VGDLNPVLRGWGNYFWWGNSGRKFTTIDRYVNERLAIFASTKHGLRGRNWASRFSYAWYQGLGVYQLSGTVRYRTARMPDGERCRRAVCGRTARTVR
jgi:Group II intron, maturase-specific domain